MEFNSGFKGLNSARKGITQDFRKRRGI